MIPNTTFISGIDTDCGKTFVTGHIARNLQMQGHRVTTHKMVQTGCKGAALDLLEHRRIMGITLTEADVNGTSCPYVFTYPASPHLAASLDGKTIDLEKIAHSMHQLASRFDIVLSEGAGGLMVPLTPTQTTFDFIQHHQLPLILVSSSKLGSINHTLLSLEACKMHNVCLRALVYNVFPDHDAVIARDTRNILKSALSETFPQACFVDSEQLITHKFDCSVLFP